MWSETLLPPAWKYRIWPPARGRRSETTKLISEAVVCAMAYDSARRSPVSRTRGMSPSNPPP
jgi:hypothetical protein